MRILATRVLSAFLICLLIISESRWTSVSPNVSAGLFFAGMVLVGIASLGRMWCSLYIAGRKDRILVTVGPYSITRNPLYLFSLIGAVGVCLTTETLSLPMLVAGSFFLYYPFVIRAEEKKLSLLFPEEFPRYATAVPRFFPRRLRAVEPSSYEVDPKIFRRHIASALWFIWAVGFIRVIEELHALRVIPSSISLY